MSDRPRDEATLRRIASKSKLQASLLAFVAGPLGYAYVGKWGLAVLCLLTLNWFLLGFLVAPLHVQRIIESARSDLDAMEADRGDDGAHGASPA